MWNTAIKKLQKADQISKYVYSIMTLSHQCEKKQLHKNQQTVQFL